MHAPEEPVRQRNDSGYPLLSNDLGREIAGGEEFEYPELITGCTDLEPPEPAPAEEDGGPAGAGEDTTGSPAAGAPGGAAARKRRAAAAAGGE